MPFPSLSKETLSQLITLSQSATGKDEIKKQIQVLYPKLNDEDAEAFLHYLSIKQTRSEVYQRLADS